MADKEALFQQAKDLGLKPHPNAGEEKLLKMIADKQPENAAGSGNGSGEQGAGSGNQDNPDQGQANAASNVAPPSPQVDQVEARVLERMKHNGVFYGPGTDRDTVALNSGEFDILEALKVVERITED